MQRQKSMHANVGKGRQSEASKQAKAGREK